MQPYLITTPPDRQPDLSHKIYDAVNNGSFAVIIVSALFLVYTKRAIDKWLASPAAKSFLELMEQIKKNQDHIGTLAGDVDRLDKTTIDLLEQLGDLQDVVKQSGELSRQEYRMIIQELNTIRTLLDRRGLQ